MDVWLAQSLLMMVCFYLDSDVLVEEDRMMDPEKVEFNASVCDLILAYALVILGGE